MNVLNKLKNKNKRRDPNEREKPTLEPASELGLVDVDRIINTLLRGKRQPGQLFQVNLKSDDIFWLCNLSREIFLSQPSFLELTPPLHILGDIHGQYQDLLRWFDLVGYPPKNYFLFLGDYVDRGDQCIETICLLLAYKIKYPEIFFMLRGNHECETLNLVYGFYDECLNRYDKTIWKIFTDMFNCLPIAALIDDKIFCCHGGISPSLKTLNEIRELRRPIDVPQSGFVCDLLWADPDPYIDGYQNSERGVSFSFGKQALDAFLEKHNLDLICRGHQVVEDGYELLFDRHVVTVFSAPNYCGEFDNAGGMMLINEELVCTFVILKPPFKK